MIKIVVKPRPEWKTNKNEWSAATISRKNNNDDKSMISRDSINQSLQLDVMLFTREIL